MTELDKRGDPHAAQFAQRFFKTGKGQYGEDDIFIGITVPVTRKVAADFRDLPLKEIEQVLESPIHEHRLAAVIIMTEQAKRTKDPVLQRDLYELYLRRSDRINNWDLVDVSCRQVVGGYLIDKPRDPLYKLARSKSLWERRIAMVSTWQFIRAGQLADTFAIAEILLGDQHDLMHKAVGWMLREAGKKNQDALCDFLDQYAATMPRTALRYALERLAPGERDYYMKLRPSGVK